MSARLRDKLEWKITLIVGFSLSALSVLSEEQIFSSPRSSTSCPDGQTQKHRTKTSLTFQAFISGTSFFSDVWKSLHLRPGWGSQSAPASMMASSTNTLRVMGERKHGRWLNTDHRPAATKAASFLMLSGSKRKMRRQISGCT